MGTTAETCRASCGNAMYDVKEEIFSCEEWRKAEEIPPVLWEIGERVNRRRGKITGVCGSAGGTLVWSVQHVRTVISRFDDTHSSANYAISLLATWNSRRTMARLTGAG